MLPKIIPDQPYRTLLSQVAILAALIHAIFFGLFFWANIISLAWVNIASILAHLSAHFLIKKGQLARGFAILALEVFAHAVIATFVLGWESGFHYYLILLLPVTAVNDNLKQQTKIALVSILAAGYVIMDLMLRGRSETHNLPHTVIATLYYFNVVGTLAIMCFIAFVYYHLIVLAETALNAVASTDPLTQLSNRRCFMLAVHQELTANPDNRNNLTFMLCDIDHFKKINDAYGHEAGDEVLKKVAEVLKGETRPSDKVARWGGEEFIFMFPSTTQDEAHAVADRIRKKLENLSFFETEKQFFITLTFGIASLRSLEKPEQVFARADLNLYKGKHAGRDCVIAS